jgi:hypothetical protein
MLLTGITSMNIVSARRCGHSAYPFLQIIDRYRGREAIS